MQFIPLPAYSAPLHGFASVANFEAIGGKLYLSESTTKSHIARIYQKLGAANRAQALVTAMRIGLLSSVNPDATAR